MSELSEALKRLDRKLFRLGYIPSIDQDRQALGIELERLQDLAVALEALTDPCPEKCWDGTTVENVWDGSGPACTECEGGRVARQPDTEQGGRKVIMDDPLAPRESQVVDLMEALERSVADARAERLRDESGSWENNNG